MVSVSQPIPPLRIIRDEEAPAYDGQQRSGPFTMIPETVRNLRDGYAVAVYEAIARHANQSGESWPSVALISQETGWSRKIIEPAINRLVEAGVLSKEKRSVKGMKNSNLYRLLANVRIVPTAPTLVPTVQLDSTHNTVGTFPQNHELYTGELEPVELEKPPVVPRKKTSTKPFVMPDDFTLSDELLDYADSKGMGQKEAEGLFEEMQLWSRSTGGKYLDWNAAFQNWVRRRVADKPRGQAPPVRSPYRKFTREEEDAERLARGLDHIDPSGKLIRAPKPIGGYPQ